jgi:hypothetical protein
MEDGYSKGSVYAVGEYVEVSRTLAVVKSQRGYCTTERKRHVPAKWAGARLSLG